MGSPEFPVADLSPVGDDLISASTSIVLEIAHRLEDPDAAWDLGVMAGSQTLQPWGRRWLPWDVASGPASLVLLFNHLDRCMPGQGWDQVAHRHLERITTCLTTSAVKMDPGTGLLGGLAGLGFVVDYSRNGRVRYRRLQAELDMEVLNRFDSFPPDASRHSTGVSSHDYDLVTGLSGRLVYLLARREVEPAGQLLDNYLKLLVSLAIRQPSCQGFYTPPELLPSDHHRQAYPAGCVDLGMAHGIPGVVSALCLALDAGFAVPGQREAIERLCSTLLDEAVWDEEGPKWPNALVQPKKSTAVFAMTWCYGALGVAGALAMAGRVLQRPDLCEVAITAVIAAARRAALPGGATQTHILCHGTAGLLQVLARFATHTSSPGVQEGVKLAARRLIAAFDERLPVGYVDKEYDPATGQSWWIDSSGFLDGASGIALALCTVAFSTVPAWDRLLLLS